MRDYGVYWAMPVDDKLQVFPSLDLAKQFFTDVK
jgi:hypothetical protein